MRIAQETLTLTLMGGVGREDTNVRLAVAVAPPWRRRCRLSMVDARPDHFDEVCKYMYYVYFLFLPLLLFRSFDSISSSNLNPTLEIDPMTKSLSKSRAAQWFKTFFMLSILTRVMRCFILCFNVFVCIFQF